MSSTAKGVIYDAGDGALASPTGTGPYTTLLSSCHARGFVAEVVADGATARDRLADLIPAGADITTGGSQTLRQIRSEEHTSELQSLMRISYAVFCLKKKNIIQKE